MNGRTLEKYWFLRTERTTAGDGGIEREQIRKKNGEMYRRTQ